MIIAHKDDSIQFEKLISNVVFELQQDAKSRNDYYLGRGGVNLEKDVYNFVKKQAEDTIFKGNIELISGQKFPDIVAYVDDNNAHGLEVKTTKKDSWKSTGSSIFEGTRVSGVQNIHLLFGKLSDPVEFMCRKYEDCLYSVAITHSPRYLIDMQTGENNSIFSKVGVEYDELRQLQNPFDPIKKHLRKGLKKGEDIWWIDNNDEGNGYCNSSVKLWGELPINEKERLRMMAAAHFPYIFGNNSKKYAPLATWLVSRFGVVNHALRDTFTAGGKISIDKVDNFPQIYTYLKDEVSLNKIYQNIKKISCDDIEYYWGVKLSKNNDRIELWNKLCLESCSGLSVKQTNIIKQIFKNNNRN